MASVTISNVRKNYGSFGVIHGLNVDVKDGEFVILVGPSGCGKSTLLRMVAGLEEITGGEILIGGQVVNEIAPKNRNIAMVFQNYALYPHMTVARNMEFALRLAGVARAQREERVRRAADILGLTSLLDRYPRQLSGGQRQRVAMGRAIVRAPQVFLFDEPLSNLDAKLRVQMRAEIKSLHQRLRATMIYVTHDQIEAMTMADKIVVMNAGNIEQIGSPLELYDRPINLFVAGFIGSPSMNFVEGRIEDGDFVTGTTRWPIPGQVKHNTGAVIYGIRPEHITMRPDRLRLKIDILEPTGSETQVYGSVDGIPLTGIFRERISARPGECLSIEPEVAHVHLFDKKTGKRLNRQSHDNGS